MGGKYAKKRKQVLKALEKSGLKDVPKDPKTGKYVTARLNTDRKKVRRNFIGNAIIYCCPKCGMRLSHKRKLHKNLCMNCGQYLDWSECENIHTVSLLVTDGEEAGYWAAQYEEALAGSAFQTQIDIDAWRLIPKRYPLELYFSFPEGKGYGRFMRKAAKEARIITDIFKEGYDASGNNR